MSNSPNPAVYTYAIRLYNLLKERDFFEVSELQKLLETNYKHTSDFKRFTVKRSVDWIRENIGHDIKYKFITVGKSNKYIKFYKPYDFDFPVIRSVDDFLRCCIYDDEIVNPSAIYDAFGIDDNFPFPDSVPPMDCYCPDDYIDD